MATIIDSQFQAEVKALPNDIDKMLVFCTKKNCSDLFITVGKQAAVYRYGIVYYTAKKTDTIAWNKFTAKAITSEMNTKYVRTKMLDFQYTVDKFRYRVNASYSMGANIATFRMLSERLPSFSSLNIDDNVAALMERAFSAKTGVTMLCGVTGSGKTSTLAAAINTFTNGNINRNLPLKDGHLITLEDPIEYVYPSTQNTLIQQKELGNDFKAFDLGVKSALREHPTHILVGETRDNETIKSLIEATVTGHLCLTTFHAGDVAETISRLFSHLVNDNQDVMFDLINCFNFILCQELIKGRGGYTLNYQYLFFNETIKQFLIKAIYEGKNIPDTVNALMHNKKLLESGLAADWKYQRKK